ncbi:MAG: DUF2088 domain-containing protein [Chloroflexi bacterium]|nr:DUF2088 domain-containing protein [Chloroflexota bacterium]
MGSVTLRFPDGLVATDGLPTMYRARQHFPSRRIDDLEGAVRRELTVLDGAIRAGSRIGITAGSRGVANLVALLRAVAQEVRARGAEPFVLAAMGSHGGGTSEGQIEMLAGYGVTPESVGMPIAASMAVEQIGQLENGMPVYWSVDALRADGVILFNRVKPHTDFRGEIESGLAKIGAIGLGKRRGAETIHAYGTEGLTRRMPATARLICERGPVLLGLGVVEDGNDETAIVRAIPAGEIGNAGERRLLEEARALMPSLPFEQIDVLVVDRLGKEISGSGLDPNVTGRLAIFGVPEPERPRVTNIVALELTVASHGNAAGLGLADFIPERLLRQVDFEAFYVNSLTSGIGGVFRGKIPFVLGSDGEAIAAALRMCGRPDPTAARLVRIQDTLHLGELWISASLLEEARAHSRLTLASAPVAWELDERGTLRSEWAERGSALALTGGERS